MKTARAVVCGSLVVLAAASAGAQAPPSFDKSYASAVRLAEAFASDTSSDDASEPKAEGKTEGKPQDQTQPSCQQWLGPIISPRKKIDRSWNDRKILVMASKHPTPRINKSYLDLINFLQNHPEYARCKHLLEQQSSAAAAPARRGRPAPPPGKAARKI